MVLNDLGRSINHALGSLLQNETAIDEKVPRTSRGRLDLRTGAR